MFQTIRSVFHCSNHHCGWLLNNHSKHSLSWSSLEGWLGLGGPGGIQILWDDLKFLTTTIVTAIHTANCSGNLGQIQWMHSNFLPTEISWRLAQPSQQFGVYKKNLGTGCPSPAMLRSVDVLSLCHRKGHQFEDKTETQGRLETWSNHTWACYFSETFKLYE